MQPNTPIPNCPIHNVPMKWKEGTNAKGAYEFWACPTPPVNDPMGSGRKLFCKAKPVMPATPYGVHSTAIGFPPEAPTTPQTYEVPKTRAEAVMLDFEALREKLNFDLQEIADKIKTEMGIY